MEYNTQNPHNLDQLYDPLSDQEILSYLMPTDGFKEQYPYPQSSPSSENFMANSSGFESPNLSSDMMYEKADKRSKMDEIYSVAFRCKSTAEVLDDGYKWRKYGKKSVKNSPNLRNYYKCSNCGCNVKKRVERDREDANYVITTYLGKHSHEIPGVYEPVPLMVSADGLLVLQP